MFDAKKLTEEQLSTLQGWAAEGAQLADIQKRMLGEMDLSLTYMDTRFLILDLGIELENPDAEEVADDDTQKELTEDDLEILPPPADAAVAGGGAQVKVSVDEIARPGVMASGRVTFSDQQGGMWYVDEAGRLGVDPDTEGYQPTEADLMAFQRELQTAMDRS